MPIYEYRCVECSDETEVIQRVDAAPKRRCGKCSGRLEKLISRTSFHLKGGGWFSEGYDSTGKSSSKSSSSGGSASTGATKSKGSSDTKSKSTKSSEKKASSA